MKPHSPGFSIVLTTVCLLAAACDSGSLRPESKGSSLADLPAAPGAYRLEAGDVVDFKFYYESKLNQTCTIRPDGMVSLPLVNDVRAAGRTPTELGQELTHLYKDHIENPDVTVIVQQSAAGRIYVGGEVNAPGMFPMAGNITALQAIIQAGWIKDSGSIDSVVLLRNQGTDTPLFLVLNLKKTITGTEADQNILLRPQDILFVPKTQIAEADTFVAQYINDLIPFSRSVGAQYNWGNLGVK